MYGFIMGILSAFSFGTADFLAGITSRRIGSYTTLFYMQLVGAIGLSIYLFFSGDWSIFINHMDAVGLAMLFMGIDVIGILCLYQGLAKGNVSVVAPITSSFAAITVILAIIFGERPSFITIAGIILSIAGVIFASLRFNTAASTKTTNPSSGILWAILAALLLGIAFFGLKYPTVEIGPFMTVWIGRLQAVILLPLLLLIPKRQWVIPQLKEAGLLLLVGIFDVIAIISYNLGLMQADTTIVVTLTSLFAIVTIIWGVVVLAERMIWNEAVGIVSILIGLVLISL
ncbi:EamA family transporter [Shimazuella kribbensis]|uniref:EamA family transporter n=1 Tax=Shimazuella kribbensis TaxID=139808 RepID=UPI000404234D|nr:EamA family transporter [Shimazuella kribbensis]